MEQMNKDLIACLRSALFDECFNCDIVTCIPLASQHGLSHLLYYALAKLPQENRPDELLCAGLKRKAYASLIREAAQQRTVEALFDRFEEAAIRCVPLKGIVVKKFYPKPELRYMSDIDLLVDAERTADVRRIFEEMGAHVLNYEQGDTDLYITTEGLVFEIKRTLRGEGFNQATVRFLNDLLSLASPMKDRKYVSDLPNEEQYAYILCHMVKHLLDGGVGVRPVMDLWFCKKNMQLNEEKLAALLAELKLTEFAQKAEHLASVWFGSEKETPMDAELGEYILSSGSFGSEEHRVADRMLQNKGQKSRFTYALARFFLPYKTMRRYFPVLGKWPILLPAFWVWRLIRAIFFRRAKLTEEISAVGDASSRTLSQRLEFYSRCGIDISEK